MKDRAPFHAASAAQTVESHGNAVEATPRARKVAAPAAGLAVPAILHRRGRGSVRRNRMGGARGRHRQRARRRGVRAARRRDSQELVAAGHQHRGVEVFPRSARIAGARAQRQAADRPRRQHDYRVGAHAALLRHRRGSARVQRRPEAHPRLPEGGVQQSGLVQLRLRESAAVLRLLHQLGQRHDGFDPDVGADRGDAVQVRIGHRHEPVADSLLARAAGRRRHGLGSGLLHEGLRRVRRRHQVGRQDAARGEDGDPRRRPSRHRGLHQLQGRRREEGVGADRRRLRRIVHRSGLLVDLLPELEQQRARHRRLHARGAGRRELGDARGHQRRGDGYLQGARSDAPDRRRHAHLRRPGHAVRHDDQRVAHLLEHGSHLRQQSVLGVHVPQRFGVQPGVDQPDEVRQGRRRVRRRRLQGRDPHADHGAGDHRRQRELSDRR